jgi:G:T-mismatch repair DNA endonuclease (very short patch repair protein)
MTNILEGYCGCGCGELTNIFRGKPRKFIKGHQARGENNSRFGIVMDAELKEKISVVRIEQGNPWWIGRKHKESSKKLMSAYHMGKVTTPRQGIYKSCSVCEKEFYTVQSRVESSMYCSIECRDKDYSIRYNGENNPFYGKTHTEETKEKLKILGTIQRSLAFVLPSKPESRVHEELTKLGIIFETEKLINNKFCVDVFVPQYNLIIYVDGCYWHACPTHCPNAKKPRTDNARVPYLTKCGYAVELIWEHDINKDIEKIIKNICLKYNIQK